MRLAEIVELPLFLHKISAGFPSPATDYAQETLDLNELLVKHKAASFYFTVEGQSMIGAQIDDGDRVLVDRSIPVRSGHIVIAVVNSEYTIKRLYMRDDVIELRPENPDFPIIRLKDGESLEVWGVVSAVIRKLK
eukprot:gene27277-30115_t